MSERNLLRQTQDAIWAMHMSTRDVRWVGVEGDWWMTWEDFEEEAKAHDRGFGWGVINEGLVVVADDWWLERDGDTWKAKWHPYKPDGYKRNNLEGD